jgi:hypothetical protein
VRKETKDFLNLFFNEGETICVSNSKYGYHSINQEDLNDDFTLISPNKDIKPFKISEYDINLMALNPVKGFRQDDNVTAFRSFLVEVDGLSLPEQRSYIDKMEMPFSACVFSGSKSLHFGIVLDKDLESIENYKFIAEWILNIMSKADQLTKNPTRSIRFPNNKRVETGNIQRLIWLKERIKKEDLYIWLNKHPDKKPKPKIIDREYDVKLAGGNLTSLPVWLLAELHNGIDFSKRGGRQNTWFKLGIEFCKAGFTLDQAAAELDKFYQEERDFNRNEWYNSIRNGFNQVLRGNK